MKRILVILVGGLLFSLNVAGGEISDLVGNMSSSQDECTEKGSESVSEVPEDFILYVEAKTVKV